MEQAKEVLGGIEFADGPYACAEGADALVIVTEWDQFRALDLERLQTLMRRRCWSTCATSTARRRSRASPIMASGGPVNRRSGTRPSRFGLGSAILRVSPTVTSGMARRPCCSQPSTSPMARSWTGLSFYGTLVHIKRPPIPTPCVA